MKRFILSGSFFLIAAVLFYFFLISENSATANELDSSTKSYLLETPAPTVNGVVTNIWLDNLSQLEKFRQNGIKYLLVDVGGIEAIGLGTQKEQIQRFMDLISNYEINSGYDFILLPYSEINTDKYQFDNDFARTITADYISLNEMGFDGAFVDIEPVKKTQRELYITLLQDLRQSLPNAMVAVYSGSVGESSDWEWNLDFFKKVSKQADLIVLQGYDSGLTNTEDYVRHLNKQLSAISSENLNSMFMLAVPTHKPYPETLQNALSAYSTHKNPFIGIAVFSSWTITDEEWLVLESLE